MKKGLIVVIFSAFAALMLLPGGYGAWTDVLTIRGRINIVEPPPPPAPLVAPTPTPAPAEGEGVLVITPPDNTSTDIPESTDNTGGQEGSSPEQAQPVDGPEEVADTGDSPDTSEPTDEGAGSESTAPAETPAEELPEQEQPGEEQPEEEGVQSETPDEAEAVGEEQTDPSDPEPDSAVEPSGPAEGPENEANDQEQSGSGGTDTDNSTIVGE